MAGFAARQLTRQISGANYAQGRSWGYDNMGVWVDRGCQAEFQVWTGGRPIDGGALLVAGRKKEDVSRWWTHSERAN
jgi:hypothetical protein